MINAIAALGQYHREQNPGLDLLDMVLDDAWDNGKNKHLFVVVFAPKSDGHNPDDLPAEWEFKSVAYFELDGSFKNKILYKRGSSRGTDFTPTAKITDLKKNTFDDKIVKWFGQNQTKANICNAEQRMLAGLYEEIVRNRDRIILSVSEKMEMFSEKSGQVLSIGFEKEAGQLAFIGEYQLFRKFLTEEAVADFKYSKTNKAFSFSQHNLCSVCNARQPEVFGFFTDLKFYNVDKQGMISGGFRYEDAWKNYPVCLDCALNIRSGYDFLKSKFDFRFYGLRYLFIPRVSGTTVLDTIFENLLGYKNQSFKPENVNRLTNDEDELFDFLQEEQTNLSFDLFFYEMPQKSVLRILLMIQDVLPSRIKKIFLIKKGLDQITFFKDARSKDGMPLCFFSFGILRNFFPNSNIEGNFDKYFLEITDKIFKAKSIDRLFMQHHIMNKLKTRFAKDESLWLDTLKGFMLLLFLQKLKNTEVLMDEQFFRNFSIRTKEEFETRVREFFNGFQDFFQTPAHQAIFLLGVLARFLLNIQKNERSATPFRSKLKGLKMTAYDLSVLLPEIIEKLEQYEKNYYRPQEELVSKLLLAAGNYKNWHLPIDEMNFVFVLGMNLAGYFKIKAVEEKIEDEAGERGA